MAAVAVVGAGKSGQAAARWLALGGRRVVLWDGRDSEALRVVAGALAPFGVEAVLGREFVPEEPDLSLVVVSPGVRWDHPGLVAARARGVTVTGEVGLAWESLSHRRWLCVTGTNGKTTTTALVGHILKTAGLRAPVCGNIGRPVTDLLLEPEDYDWIVAELSSFQIESAQGIRPEVAVWTTFTPDHLNRHGTLERYAAIKAGLLMQARRAVLNGDDAYLGARRSAWPDAWWTSTQAPAAVSLAGKDICIENRPVLPVSAVRLPGAHNLQNVLMAVAACHLTGVGDAAIASGVASFIGVPHRLEAVGEYRGVRFINDSKATNYDAALVGLTAVPAPSVLIAGGQAKTGESGPWLRAIAERCASVVLIGEAAPLFEKWLRAQDYRAVYTAHTLERAVPMAFEQARAQGAQCVLFSPACASFDQFRNFEERGDRFRALIAALAS
ncbi:UDP-N-acetylmuramoylalanine--D-glutamate ligase [Gloeobacter violaceus PCC 7421]|uniref:UDP-N-acetylmuramoylalanine--D-glutamate ligase n=2 Tax=Gloeobacter violaceus TaxID=33072 RepID=MURD_GLOVI|nr:RecName: Full=UDP-N-acetylmuramoylalanine--D-glutamate ligase; AltName: Full=D-glutamic acid-adding enzyme; AltName: Full=UDP-N-acetylmuramoyl-L-alanyl-D-glutamate synthetase [Gloeobacter violaceus PCC 7421]BAC91673.1 UDP-N-acetylmuramoylalanine--D-glutamate ligase [Gloeobacter violaceus PCC 7421]